MDTTVFSSPKRENGITGGSANWRGNPPPTLSRDLFLWLRPKKVIDPMSGSGTTGDVARQLGIPFWQSDLHSGFDVLKDEFPCQGDLDLLPRSLLGYHPLFWGVWGKQPHPDDLSRCPDYDTFIRKMDIAHYNGYQALRSGGHLVILVGDVKAQGCTLPTAARLPLVRRAGTDADQAPAQRLEQRANLLRLPRPAHYARVRDRHTQAEAVRIGLDGLGSQDGTLPVRPAERQEPTLAWDRLDRPGATRRFGLATGNLLRDECPRARQICRRQGSGLAGHHSPGLAGNVPIGRTWCVGFACSLGR